jgi:hypothetical protein
MQDESPLGQWTKGGFVVELVPGKSRAAKVRGDQGLISPMMPK